jgi:hypothetical protein
MQIKTKFLNYMFEKWILYTFIRGIVMYVYFEFTIPLKAYNGKTFSALLPTVQKNDRHCCL